MCDPRLSPSSSTEAIVSSLPDDKAGVGSAVNDTTREVGGAVGIAVMGSLLSQGYTNGIQPVLRFVPEQLRGFVEDSIGGAVFAADAAPPEAAAQLLATANEAFVDGLQTAFLTAAGVGTVTAVVVWLFHPDRTRGVEAADGAPRDPVVAATLDP